nr:polyprenyl synthetase family protein [Calidifontibacter indicus]
MAFESRESVSVDECLDMVRQKTALFFETAGALGARLGRGSAELADSMRLVGRNVGMAYQMCDDIAGLIGDVAVTGKARGQDLRRAKKSLPVTLAMDAAPGALGDELSAALATSDHPAVRAAARMCRRHVESALRSIGTGSGVGVGDLQALIEAIFEPVLAHLGPDVVSVH